MAILVSDTSVLIDLERGELLELAFSCGHTMVVPDLLYENELQSDIGPQLIDLGLQVIQLGPDEVALAQNIKSGRPQLSFADCFGLACATRQNHALLAGDGNLRKEAAARNVSVFGIFWLLEEIEKASGQVVTSLLHAGLTKISGDARCRLPKEKTKSLLEKWGKT